MSRQNSRLQPLFAGDVDVTVAKFGFLACLLLFSLRLLAEQALLVVIPVAGSSAFGLYILTRRKNIREFTPPTMSRHVAGFLPSMVFIGIALLIVVVSHTGGRSLAIHLLSGGIGVVILLQILLAETHPFHPVVVLFQILVASVVIRFSAVLASPGYVGVDIWTHVPIYISGIVEEGSLTAIADVKYVMAPIYHLNGAVGALVFDSPRFGLFLTVGLIVGLVGLAIYSTARLLVPARWALLATALYTFSDQAIRWGIHVIPNSLGLVFFLGGLYSLTKLYYGDDVRYLLLLFVCTLAIVFTHQVSTAIMLLVLGIASAVSAVLLVTPLRSTVGASVRTTFGVVLVFLSNLVITVFSWSNTPFGGEFIFLPRMLNVLQEQVASDAGFLNLASTDGGDAVVGMTASEGTTAQLVPFIEWFGFSLLLLTGIIGSIILLRSKEPTDFSLTYLVVLGTMFVVIYGLSLFGLRTLMPGRWMAFLYAPMVIVAAIGLYYLSDNASRTVLLVVFLVIALGYPTTMLVADRATFDSPAFEDQNPRFSYTEEEIAAVETITTVRPPEVAVALESDHPYQTLFFRLGEYEPRTLLLTDGQPVYSDAVVAREYQQEGPTIVFEDGEPPIRHASHLYLEASVCPPTHNHLYSNGDVTLCTPGATTGAGP